MMSQETPVPVLPEVYKGEPVSKATSKNIRGGSQ